MLKFKNFSNLRSIRLKFIKYFTINYSFYLIKIFIKIHISISNECRRNFRRN